MTNELDDPAIYYSIYNRYTDEIVNIPIGYTEYVYYISIPLSYRKIPYYITADRCPSIDEFICAYGKDKLGIED